MIFNLDFPLECIQLFLILKVTFSHQEQITFNFINTS